MCRSIDLKLEPDAAPARSCMNVLLRMHVRGLTIDAQCGHGGVVHLVARAQQQHKGPWLRLRQHIAHALFRAGDLCHPGDDDAALRVVELHVPAAALDDGLPQRADAYVRQIWPVHAANGDAHYQALLVHEGVKRHHDGRPAVHCSERFGRQKGANDAHVVSVPQGATVWLDDDTAGGAA